jgi:hypothetical protein
LGSIRFIQIGIFSIFGGESFLINIELLRLNNERMVLSKMVALCPAERFRA